MARTATEQLARSTAADLLDARRYRGDLVNAAHHLVLAAHHDPDVARCAEAGCGLAHLDPTARLCAVAHRVGGLEDPPPQVVGNLPSLEAALHGFVVALSTSFVPVRACRQTAHPSGTCWFTDAPGTDGCADVLHLAHRLSA